MDQDLTLPKTNPIEQQVIKMDQHSLVERFLRYVKIDTRSDEDSATHPSTAKQHNLAKLLVEELKELGLDVDYDVEHCFI